jgi:hypothetical protein
MVLTKDTTQVAAAEKDAARAVVARDAGFFAKVRADDIDLSGLRTNETVPGLLVPVNATEARAKVAVAEVGVGKGTFTRGVDGGEEMVPGDVVVEEKWWGEMEGAATLDSGRRANPRIECGLQSRYCPHSRGQFHHAVSIPCLV